MKRTLKLLTILSILIMVIFISYQILLKKNKYVREWHELPKNIKHQAVSLSSELLLNNIKEPDVNEEFLKKITSEKIKKSLIMGADWILAIQEPCGRFKYSYNIEEKKFNPDHVDNFLRQAGTGYSLTLAYEVTGNTDYLNAAKQNLNYLQRYRKDLDTTKSHFLYAKKSKLGGVALPMLTMLKIKSMENDSSYDNDLRKLANMIVFLQDLYGTGQFKSTYVYRGDFEYEKHTGWESKIYPGEALLALVLMYKEFGDAKYKEAIDKAFMYYKNNGWHRNLPFIPWATSAFAELYKITRDQKYANFVFKMCDFTLRRQNLNEERQVYGSFDPLPTIFTSVSFEGIGEALIVCKLTGNEEKYLHYKERSLIAYNWIMQLQFKGEDSLAYGGFQTSLFDSEIRIDNTQHSISALAKGLKYIY